MHIQDWTRDDPTYRWRIEGPAHDEHGLLRDLVMEFAANCVIVYLRHWNDSQPPEPVPIPSSRCVLLYQDALREDRFDFGPLLLALAARDIRGDAECQAIERVYWHLFVKDRPGWGLMERYVPGLRAWYDREIERMQHEAQA